MGKKSREITLSAVSAFFEELPLKVFKRAQIARLLEENRIPWKAAPSITPHRFIGLLLEQTPLREIRLEFPSRPEIRFAWGDASIYQLLMSLNRKAYCSHYTAMVLHGLTEQIPKTW